MLLGNRARKSNDDLGKPDGTVLAISSPQCINIAFIG